MEAGRWLLDHWKEGGWIFAIVFALLWNGASGKLTTCSAALDAERAKGPTVIYQTVTVAAKSNVRAAVVFPRDAQGNPSPCPDVTLDADTQALINSALGQAAMAPEAPAAPFWGFEISGSTGFTGAASFGGGVLAGPLRATAEYSPYGIDHHRVGLGYQHRFK